MSGILIIGATGQQGGSVIDALEGRSHSVVGFVRDRASEKAQALASRGVELVLGELDDPASIEAAMRGRDAAFAVTSPFTTSVEVEAQQGINIAEAAAAAKLPHLVYSSVGSADEGTGIGHFDSKFKVEQRIAELGIPAAVIAPVFFMENYLFPWNIADVDEGRVREAIPAHKTLQLLSSADIGKSAAIVLEQPERFAGERIELVGDELTGPRIAEVLGAAIGRQLEFQVQPLDELDAMGNDMRLMYEWLTVTGYSADAGRLARALPEVRFTTFAEWVGAQDWASLLRPVLA
jgi:uncharacterized protein YbjT (DUF2867 family)